MLLQDRLLHSSHPSETQSSLLPKYLFTMIVSVLVNPIAFVCRRYIAGDPRNGGAAAGGGERGGGPPGGGKRGGGAPAES